MHLVFKTAVGSVLPILLAVSACRGEAASGLESQEALAKQVLASIGANNQKALGQIVITEDEFKQYVWPTIASRVSGQQMNAKKFYGVYQKSSTAGLEASFRSLAGKEWQLVRVSPGTGRRVAKGAHLFDAPMLTVRNGAGEEKLLKLIGGDLEHDGSFKVTSYFVVPPRQQQ